jgi:predicted Zn-dependent protease
MTTPQTTVMSLVFILLCSACTSLTPEEEIAIGDAQVQEINASIKLIDDPVVVNYVDALVKQLLASTTAPDDIKVRIIDTDGFNAFAISGNNVYLTAGTIKASNNVAELASIVAHELAHVIEGHQRRFYRSFKATRAVANVAGIALALATGNPFLVGAGGVASDIGASTYINTHTREQERAADELAFKLMLDAGYDPRSQLTLFGRLDLYRDRPDIPVFLQTHPLPKERIQNTQARLAALPAGLRLRVHDDGALENIKSHL